MIDARQRHLTYKFGILESLWANLFAMAAFHLRKRMQTVSLLRAISLSFFSSFFTRKLKRLCGRIAISMRNEEFVRSKMSIGAGGAAGGGTLPKMSLMFVLCRYIGIFVISFFIRLVAAYTFSAVSIIDFICGGESCLLFSVSCLISGK